MSEAAGTVTVIDSGAVIVAESPCLQVSDHEATCPGVRIFRALLGDRNDSAFVLEQGRVAMILEGNKGNDHLTMCSSCHGDLWGEPGADTLTGGASRDFMYGGWGADLIAGRAGDDFIHGDNGTDRLLGNRGDDHLYAEDGLGDFVGGGRGFDRARIDESDVVRRVETLL